MSNILDEIEEVAGVMTIAETDIQEENPQKAIQRIFEEIGQLSKDLLKEPADSENVIMYRSLVWLLFQFYYEHGLNNCEN